MNLIEQSVEQISKENFRNYYDREQAEEELMDMLQSNRLFKMKDTTLDFIKKLTLSFFLFCFIILSDWTDHIFTP